MSIINRCLLVLRSYLESLLKVFQIFKVFGALKIRFEVLNVFDYKS